jgi:hypothetical protein
MSRYSRCVDMSMLTGSFLSRLLCKLPRLAVIVMTLLTRMFVSYLDYVSSSFGRMLYSVDPRYRLIC